MSIVYLVPTPENKLDVKGRVSGWHFIPLAGKASVKETWRTLLAQLKDKGVEKVYSADLDSEAAKIAADELKVPFSAEYKLRRFNYGRHHGGALNIVADILRKLEGKWKENPDIPIKEGDSLTSFERRFSRRFNNLLSATGISVLVTDPQTIAFIRDGMNAHAIVPNGNPVKRGKIYKVQNARPDS